jgi:carbamoyltransferase
VLEETVLEHCRWLHSRTGCDDLCIAGGVALNGVMNARIRDRGPFRNIWVQPAAGDDGTAIGAALWIDAKERGTDERRYVMDHAFLGPKYADEEIEVFLKWTKAPYRKLANIAEEVADILVQDKVIGWFQGRMEMGPRALGARSILASPIHAEMQARLNEIKDREDFRQVAPVVQEEHPAEWLGEKGPSPYMLYVFDVPPDKADGIPAVRHVDGTARIQTINRAQNSRYYDLLKAFHARIGVPVLVNTSFNTRGEPIVCTPRDAVDCFWTSPLDAWSSGLSYWRSRGHDAPHLRRRAHVQASGASGPVPARAGLSGPPPGRLRGRGSGRRRCRRDPSAGRGSRVFRPPEGSVHPGQRPPWPGGGPQRRLARPPGGR